MTPASPPQSKDHSLLQTSAAARLYKIQRIERLHNNIFLIRATCLVRKVAQVCRNMVVIRHNRRELTLVNPVRLDDNGLRELGRLGTIQRMIQLAPHHGTSHDSFYLDRFPWIRRWAPALSPQDSPLQQQRQIKYDLPIHRILTPDFDHGAILPGCHVFFFRETAQPECALLLLSQNHNLGGGNLLVTAHALQSHRSNPYVNALVRAKQTAEGLMQRDMVIPPTWLRQMSAPNDRGADDGPPAVKKRLVRNDYERLLRLDFEKLVSSSGVLVDQQAKELAVMAVEVAFPQW